MVDNPKELEKKVLICHYRVGWTDGVSLEINKRVEVLKNSGWKVFLLAGPKSIGADFIIDELDFDLSEIRKITENAFEKLTDYKHEEDLLKDIIGISTIIRKKLAEILDTLKPDFILLHNIFSHGRHIAGAKAFYDELIERNIPAMATHHDFYWERDHLTKATSQLIREYLNRYIPPVLPCLQHAVINSLAAKKLLDKTGIEALIIPDTMDFNHSPWEKDEYNQDLPVDFNLNENDIFILQATRIVKRKGIELIPPIIGKLNEPEYINRLRGRTIYNGKTIKSDSKFVFLIAGYAEGEAIFYRESLHQLMIREDIPFHFLESKIAAERSESEDTKIYSLYDTYSYADLISFPSQVEGWGNQFLEAVFAKKPILVYEYPVFVKDIKKIGYQYISLGDQVQIDKISKLLCLSEARIELICEEIIETLLSKKTVSGLEHNYNLAEENNSQKILSKLMSRCMEHYED